MIGTRASLLAVLVAVFTAFLSGPIADAAELRASVAPKIENAVDEVGAESNGIDEDVLAEDGDEETRKLGGKPSSKSRAGSGKGKGSSSKSSKSSSSSSKSKTKKSKTKKSKTKKSKACVPGGSCDNDDNDCCDPNEMCLATDPAGSGSICGSLLFPPCVPGGSCDCDNDCCDSNETCLTTGPAGTGDSICGPCIPTDPDLRNGYCTSAADCCTANTCIAGICLDLPQCVIDGTPCPPCVIEGTC